MRDLARPGFYFPRRLGVPRPPPRPSKEAPDRPHTQSYEAWREGLSQAEAVYAPLAETALRERLLRGIAGRAGPVMVTGEPGAGKSRLLEEVVEAWGRSASTLRLGARYPVLVRCRDLGVDDLAPSDPNALADRLWQQRSRLPRSVSSSMDSLADRALGRLWTPVWLIDGLDELPAGALGRSCLERLARLPGTVCFSCRTAVAQAERELFARLVGLHAELLPLDPEEQRDFLRYCLGDDVSRAEGLRARLSSNPQLRELAGSPLMLELIAEVGEQRLPARRAAFYREAVEVLWHRRVPSAVRDRLRPWRDHALGALAQTMRLDTPVAGTEILDQAMANLELGPADVDALRGALRTSGLLRLEHGKVEFLHLTFQEFFLAGSLADRSFAEMLDKFWTNSRYEEVLALRLALALEGEQASAADRALVVFVQQAAKDHRRDPEWLWRLGRSPLRLGLHLITRAGADVAALPAFWSHVVALVERSVQYEQTLPLWFFNRRIHRWLRRGLLRQTLAYDRRVPSVLLERLVGNPDTLVHQALAGNPSSPPSVLQRLAGDPKVGVRMEVARNPSSPSDVLERLASDPYPLVSTAVASNPSLPLEAFERLADDPGAGVRMEVARNPSSPSEVLERLASDPEEQVRRAVARNPSSPSDVLERLASDSGARVRMDVARNPSSPSSVLERLAGDPEVGVRRKVAANPSSPPSVFERLAAESYYDNMCHDLASNPSLPPNMLERFAVDYDKVVRSAVAGNPSSPSGVLERLASDPEVGVRSAVASNPSSPQNLIRRLASDTKEMEMLRCVAGNPSSPSSALEHFAGICLVGDVVAKNPRTLLEALL